MASRRPSRMLSHRLWLACVLMSALALAGGYAAAGQPLGAALAGFAALAWLHPRAPARLDNAALSGMAALAAAGLLAGARPDVMILGASAALAAWDLAAHIHESGLEGAPAVQFEARRLQSLALALGLGLLAALLGRQVRLQVPFLLQLFIALAALFSLDRLRVLARRS